MRFCPFCSAENADELTVCQSCGRRLPPLPPRRAGNAPGTGVQLPPRASTTNPPPRKAATVNPPLGDPAGAAPRPAGNAVGVPTTRGSASPVPAPPLHDPAPPPPVDEGARALASALSPGPAAQRREVPPPEPVGPGQIARRRSDQPATPMSLPAAAPRAIPSVLPNDPRPAPSAIRPASPPPPQTLASAPAGPRRAPTPPPIAQVTGVASQAPQVASDPPWANQPPRASPPASGDADTQLSMVPLARDAPRQRGADGIEPPPTRIHHPDVLVDRPFTPPTVSPVPEIPEPGLLNSARYTLRFARARWQRGGAIKTLGADIKQDTDALDQVLGALGGAARTAMVDGRVFSGENAAITAAEQHVAQMTRERNELDTRKLEENARFIDVERERNAKLGEAERMVDEAQKELAQLEAQRRELRDKRKELERRQRAYLKAAEDSDRQTGNAEQGDSRQELRRAAEQHRREAAALEPERQEIDRRVASIERPINEVNARLDAAKAELDAAKRSLSDAREGHTHRLAELDAEQKRKAREIAQAEAEIARRLVTLGTLVNLNRIDDPRFAELYQRIDRLRGAITARTTEIEKLSAEREAYDRGNLVRGVAAIGGAILLFIMLIVILRALLR